MVNWCSKQILEQIIPFKILDSSQPFLCPLPREPLDDLLEAVARDMALGPSSSLWSPLHDVCRQTRASLCPGHLVCWCMLLWGGQCLRVSKHIFTTDTLTISTTSLWLETPSENFVEKRTVNIYYNNLWI